MYKPFDTPVYVYDHTYRIALDISGDPVDFQWAPGNVGGSLAGVYYVCMVLYLKKMYLWPKL